MSFFEFKQQQSKNKFTQLLVTVVYLFIFEQKNRIMKKNIWMFAAAAVVLGACGNNAEEVVVVEPITYKLDVAASTLEWTGMKNVGDSHSGTIKFTEGSATMLADTVKSGEFVIDMKSISTTDALPAEVQQKLNGHLMTEDFFNTEKYPTAKVTIGEMTNGKFPVTINLMGVDFKSEVLPIASMVSGDQLILKGDFDFDFTGITSGGFMADPTSGEQILPKFKFKLNAVLNK